MKNEIERLVSLLSEENVDAFTVTEQLADGRMRYRAYIQPSLRPDQKRLLFTFIGDETSVYEPQSNQNYSINELAVFFQNLKSKTALDEIVQKCKDIARADVEAILETDNKTHSLYILVSRKDFVDLIAAQSNGLPSFKTTAKVLSNNNLATDIANTGTLKIVGKKFKIKEIALVAKQVSFVCLF